MQHFENAVGDRRLITIRNMKLEDVEEYYKTQFHKENKVTQEQNIRKLKKRLKGLMQQKEVYEWILAICTKDGKIIGKMEIYSADAEVASLKIEIPNEIWSFKYGVEAIKQFVKICTENHYFKKIEMEDNVITERYRRDYGLQTRFIIVA